MSLMQVVSILIAYWKISVIIAAGVLFITGIVTSVIPKKYTAIATLMVNPDVNDPLAGREFPLGMLGQYLATQVELIQSPEVLDPVIERLNLVADPEYASGNRGGDATLRDWVESKLRKDLEVDQGRGGGQLIYVSASATTASRAADIANAIAEVYTQQQDARRSGPASELAKRYTIELADLKKKVTAAQDAVTKFRSHTGNIEGNERIDIDMSVLDALEHRLLEARNNLRMGQAHAAGRQDVSASVLSSNTVTTLREEEARLKSRMAQLRATLGVNHPQVIELQSQIDANQASLAAALATYSNAASSEIVVASNEVAALEKAVSAQRQKVLEGRRIKDEGAKYALELESAQAVYKRALDGYDQIMFASTGHAANVSITSRARLPVKADKPNPVKYMLFGAVLGIILGIAGPFIFELTRRRVRCRDDVERDFGIPILTEFEKIGPAGAAS